MFAFWKASKIKNNVDIFIISWNDVFVVCVRQAWRRLMGDNTEPANFALLCKIAFFFFRRGRTAGCFNSVVTIPEEREELNKFTR